MGKLKQASSLEPAISSLSHQLCMPHPERGRVLDQGFQQALAAASSRVAVSGSGAQAAFLHHPSNLLLMEVVAWI